MPAVIDTPEVVEHEAHALYEAHDFSTEQPQVHVARSGFWHTVAAVSEAAERSQAV